MSLSPSQPLLVWPAQSACGSDEVARATTPDWAIPVENASIAVWRRPEALDGGLFASVEVALTGELCEAESGETTAPATVRVRYSLSNTDAAFPVRFARVDDRFELELLNEARMGGAPADFVARFGDFGASLMHFEHVQLEIELTFYPKSAMVVHDTRSVLSVVGFEDTCKRMCNATMCNGCGRSSPGGVQRRPRRALLKRASASATSGSSSAGAEVVGVAPPGGGSRSPSRSWRLSAGSPASGGALPASRSAAGGSSSSGRPSAARTAARRIDDAVAVGLSCPRASGYGVGRGARGRDQQLAHLVGVQLRERR